MVNRVIRMKLFSDLCPASGDGFAGVVDTDVCFEDNGLPYIPGKRLKGCLRECGLDILSVHSDYESLFGRLFGQTGQAVPGDLSIGNGRLTGYQEIIKRLPSIHPSELAEIYTSTRSRTKMENNKAAPGTLRTVRVLNRVDVFEFPITVEANSLGFLSMCVKSLRSMGLNRSRGLGEVQCEIVNVENPLSNNIRFVISDYGNAKAFSYLLTLAEPVISAERSGKPYACEEYIFGSAVLGAFAARYMKMFSLDPQTAYTDEEFRRIFLEDGVTFTAAMPYVNGETYYPAPLSLEANKTETRLVDKSGGIPEENDKSDPIRKKLSGFISIQKESSEKGQEGCPEKRAVKRMRPNKTAYIHHSRPKNKGMAHSDGNQPEGTHVPTSQDGSGHHVEPDKGHLYTYEALSKGQTFAGHVVGKKEDLELLMRLFADKTDANNDTLRIGRSRTAQYGKVKISAEIDHVASQNILKLKKDDEFRLVVITPLILEDECGINTMDLTNLMKLLDSELELIRSISTETVVAGYYGKWLLPKPQSRAIAEGSVIVFKYKGNGATLADGFFGLRNGEGFGQVRFESIPKDDAFKFCDTTSKQETGSPNEPLWQIHDGECGGSDNEISQKVLNLRAEKNAITGGTIYGNERSLMDPPLNNGLQRILSAMKASGDFRQFARKLCDIKQAGQRGAVLLFVCDKEGFYFKTDSTRLQPNHIEKLLMDRAIKLFPKIPEAERYDLYSKFLAAAATRIMQIRRDKQQKEGMSDERINES